ncbi:L,D-transpeptidase family protein [Mucilaginibacter lacusdianchii]|uniref:L,D-transpeptidase family protein n=1 Tax=Mucilaginibacter lacusdianchii TaxID=2684211 RepID=UPI00131AC658|nr:L,D-transpeptidase family protein [Mucilaginibacter sp. JXJ CY 39]
MKKLLNFSASKSYLYIGVCVLLMLLSLCAEAKSINHQTRFIDAVNDTVPTADIKTALKLYHNELYFPKSVARFYSSNNFSCVWVLPADKAGQTWQAMLALDCVLQYGLNHADYHPNDLKYAQLQQIMEKLQTVSNADKARFEIILTDAMLTFINNLHYGKLNPDFSSAKIDDPAPSAFRAETILQAALYSADLMSAVTSVQPQSIQYILLQDQLRLATAQYTGDCYEIPEATIRKMAVNLERLRWLGNTESTFIQVNIPSYTLSFCKPDTTYQFRVIVGKPATLTPTLQSAITHFTTAPEWKVPQKIFVKELLPKALKDTAYLETNHFAVYNNKGVYVIPSKQNIASILRNVNQYYARQSGGCDNALGLVVFRFPNTYDVYLHDTPQQQLFRKRDRAFSHGCVRVDQAGKLAALLLKNDGATGKIVAMQKAMAAYQNQTFILKNKVPLKITYFTCEVKDALLVTYKDVYQLDNALEQALYYTAPQLVLK